MTPRITVTAGYAEALAEGSLLVSLRTKVSEPFWAGPKAALGSNSAASTANTSYKKGTSRAQTTRFATLIRNPSKLADSRGSVPDLSTDLPDHSTCPYLIVNFFARTWNFFARTCPFYLLFPFDPLLNAAQEFSKEATGMR
jgi:hypothetical protein